MNDINNVNENLGRLLYYPHIAIADVNWIKYSLLYLDKLDHIAPAGIDLNIEYNDIYRNRFNQLDYDISDLVSSIHPSVENMLSAINYTKNVVDIMKFGYELIGDRNGVSSYQTAYETAYEYVNGDESILRRNIKRLKNLMDIDASRSLSDDEINNFLGLKLQKIKRNRNYILLYRGKFYHEDIYDSFEEYCINNNIGFIDEYETGLIVPRFIGEAYMKGLVMDISKDEKIDTITNNATLFKVNSNNINHRESISRIVCNDLLPESIERTKLEDIIRLRKSDGFKEMMREFRISIKEYSDIIECDYNNDRYRVGSYSFESFIVDKGRERFMKELRGQIKKHGIEIARDFIIFSLVGTAVNDLAPTSAGLMLDAAVRFRNGYKTIHNNNENTRLTKNYMAQVRSIGMVANRNCNIRDEHLI